MTTHYCEVEGKVGFTSPHAARKSLVGQLKSKRIRVYPCRHCHLHHVTKENKTDLKKVKSKRVHYSDRD